MASKAILYLKDGTKFTGFGFGAPVLKFGELVFNTGMQGYQEALTDPSYAGQILLMAYPLIGNYGLNEKWTESKKIHVEGFAVKKLDAHSGLDDYLNTFGVPGIYGLDTRAIVRKIRSKGVIPAVISVVPSDSEFNIPSDVFKKFDYSETNFVEMVADKNIVEYCNNSTNKTNKTVVLIDLGVKMGIIRELNKRNIRVISVPYFTSKQKIDELNPDGIVISNGPGDPSVLTDVHKLVKQLGDANYPILGICLGHQLIAHAFGGNTTKMKFGHRGVNHPVYDVIKRKVIITTHNHGYMVDKLPDDFQITYKHLNDNTIEGMKHKSKDIMSVQFHPEASPGTHDAKYIFDEFVDILKR